VVVDPHYEKKHSAVITDEIVLDLVKLLDGRIYEPEGVDDRGFQYFANDRLELAGRHYKLIWVLHEQESFIGIINAYRRLYAVPK
jgi:hypothetical protein